MSTVAKPEILTDEDRLSLLIKIDPETKRLPIGFKQYAEAIEAAVLEKIEFERLLKNARRYVWVRKTRVTLAHLSDSDFDKHADHCVANTYAPSPIP